MKIKRNVFLFVLMLLLVMVSLFTSNQGSTGSEKADLQVLVRVEVTGMLNDLNLPVYAHLQDGAGKDYALVIAPQAQLDQAGVAYRILDKDTEGVDYFILSLPSIPAGDNLPPISRLAKVDVLLDEGKHFIIRSTFKQVEALVEAGFEIQFLDRTPMVMSCPSKERMSSPAAVTYDAVIASMMDQVTQSAVETYEKNLTGVNPVSIGGDNYTIATRNTDSGTPITKATQYVYEFMQNLGLTVSYHDWSLYTYSGRNVIGERTGTYLPTEIALITAHLDDAPRNSTAPGADDNASGCVGVMMCAELLGQQQFARTIRFVFFTGEEQGCLGSSVYSNMVYGSGDNIVAVYNMDMISYDGIGLPYLRLYTRTSANPGYSGDMAIANTFVDIVNTYSLSSVLSPIITSDGLSASDHSSFWEKGYYGILSIEDLYNDKTPYLHLTTDTISTLNLAYFTNYVKAAVGTAAHLAIRDDGTVTANFSGTPSSGYAPLTVTFTDASTNATSWAWTFEGGTPATSTAQNPTVTYNAAGTFDVTLVATNALGSDTETKTDYITVNMPAALNVLSPNGGENWQLGSGHPITWNPGTVSANLKITLWKNGTQVGIIANNIAPASGSYGWTVGKYSGGTAAAGTGYAIKIKEIGTTISDISDASFTICNLTVTSPNGGESWQAGSSQNITWTASGLSANLKITLWKDGVLVGTVVNSIAPAAGSYSWTVGQYSGGTAAAGTGYTIKIKEIGTAVSDASNAVFSITN